MGWAIPQFQDGKGLPFESELPVGLPGNRSPEDVAGVAGRVDATEAQLAALGAHDVTVPTIKIIS